MMRAAAAFHRVPCTKRYAYAVCCLLAGCAARYDGVCAMLIWRSRRQRVDDEIARCYAFAAA